MTEINTNQIVNDSIIVVKTILGSRWESFKPFAEHELRQFSENAEFLAKLKLAGEINDDEFKARLDIQRMAFKTVMLGIEGIGIVTAQEAINKVIDIVAKAVKTAINISLPV
ncbi:MAG: hypothetical protein ABI772_00785 [Bacteroidota bacterium]